MARWIRVALCVLGGLAIAVVIMSKQEWLAPGGEPILAASPPDLSNHPIYSSYGFGTDDRVIDVGMQPLWVPPNMIVEAMRRDVLLTKALAKRGMEIRFHAFLKGADVNFFLFRGDLEVAIAGDMPTLTAAARGDVVVVALIQQGFCAIVARNHMLIDELKGKRIAYAFGSNAHYALLNTLSRAGLSESDVHLVPLDVNEMPDALGDGRIDAFSAWEPTPFFAVSRYEDQVIIHRSLSSGYLYFSGPFVSRNQPAAREIIAAELRAINWMRDKEKLLQAGGWAQAAGGDMRSLASALTPEDYTGLAKNDLLGMASIPAIPETDLAANGPLFKELEFLKGVGMIPDAVEWNAVVSCFDRSLVAEVLSASRQYPVREFEYVEHEGENHESN